MLGLIFIFFLGHAFYRLAEEHSRNKWIWAVVGVLFYYVFSVIVSFLGVIAATDWVLQNEMIYTFVVVAISIGASIGSYYVLKNNWEKAEKASFEDELINDL